MAILHTALLTDGVKWVPERPLGYSTRLAHSVTPGARIHTASGAVYRVMHKQASSEGIRLRLLQEGSKVEQTVGIKQLAALYPASRAARHFASLVHHLAFDQSLNSYVVGAIEHAGLPVDPSINWAKWLDAVYRPKLTPISRDPERIDEAIREVLFQLLFEQRILDKDSSYSHFNPDHPSLQGKDEDKKVSAYLAFVFKKGVRDARMYLKKGLGVGSAGAMGQEPTKSLFTTDNEGEVFERQAEPLESEEDTRLSEDEVYRFVESFKEWLRLHNARKNTVQLLIWITDQVVQGESRREMRDALATSELKNRDGQPYDVDTFKKMIAKWVAQIREFADSEENPYRETAVSRMIADRAQELVAKPGESLELTASSLHLALADTGVLPHAPYSSTTNAPVIVEPAPPVPPQNPNVQQQQDAAQRRPGAPNPAAVQNLGPGNQDFQQPQDEQLDANGMPLPKKPTIPPEIPGVNHV